MVKVRKVKTEQEFMKCLFIRFMVFVKNFKWICGKKWILEIQKQLIF